MSRWVLASVAPLLLASCAGAPVQVGQRDIGVEVGYAPGSLGYASIMRGKLDKAEAQLLRAEATIGSDPARLLNLAHVYQKTGRASQARELYAQVARTGDDTRLELANGDVATARELALRALGASKSYAP